MHAKAKTKALLLLVLSFAWVERSHGALSMIVNTATSDNLSVTISGTFDSNVAGDQPNWLALKADYFTNDGVNVNWISDAVGGAVEYSVAFTVLFDTISFSGNPVVFRRVDALSTWGDAIYWNTTNPITAGTSVSGTLSLQSVGAFDFSGVGELQLASGFDNGDSSWNRLEFGTVPEPSSSLLSVAGGAILLLRRRRRLAS